MEPFSLGSSRCAAMPRASLEEEINQHTHDAAATDRIIRSIGRFGSDPSIVRFDVIPLPYGRTARFTSAGWTVRAVRLDAPAPEATAADSPPL